MNIPPTRSGELASAARPERATQPAASAGTGRPKPPERVAVRAGQGQQDGGDQVPVSPSQRLENVSETIGARLDYLMENGDLDDAQKAAIMEAKEEFQGYLGRLGGALDGGDFEIENKAAKNFARFMGNLREEVSSALNPTQVQPPEPDQGGPVVLNERAGARRVGDGPRQEDGDQPDGVSPEALSARLDYAQQNIEDRLRYFRSQGVDEETSARLTEAYEQFSATFDRMQYGIDNGTLTLDQLGQGFQYALERLREGTRPVPPETFDQRVANNVSVDGGQPVDPSPADRLEAAADSISQRLDNVLSGLDPEAARIMQASGEAFSGLVDRLQNALTQGFDEDRAGGVFERLVGRLRSDFQEAFSSGPGNTNPAVYDADLSLAALYDLGSTGLDRSA